MRRCHFWSGFALSLVMICAVAAFGVERVSAQQPTGSLEEDWRALRALYIATDGDNWRNNTNWNITDSSVVTTANLATWYGIEVAMGRVTGVRLPENQLAGVLPLELSGLSMLQVLNLGVNYLTGKIPPDLGTLAELRVLDLGDTVSLPAYNELEGEIPPELGNLANLRILDLSANSLTAKIPAELANLRQLERLYLSHNKLEGEIPAELASLANLRVLRLGANSLTAEIPAELASLRQLERLYLSSNELEGEIPAWLGSLANLQDLDLSGNSLTAEIPAELASLRQLERLYLSSNELEGEIPAWLGSLANLRVLRLGANSLTAEIPAELASLRQLWDLYLSDNKLEGEIPSELASLRQLERLYLSENKLEGEIPSELGSLANLRTLRLGENSLTGEIPAELANLRQLETLYLSLNELEGEIPPELGNLANLRILDLSANSLTAEIPAELANLRQLGTLNLSLNELEGEIPTWLGSLANLRYLNLGENSLTGEIPASLGSLANLLNLRLGGNSLTGDLPESLGNLTRLGGLRLADNALTGALPMSLTNLQALRWFYFSGQPLCAPLAPDFQAWLQAIENHSGENCEPLSFAESIPDQRFTKGVDIGALLLPAADGGAAPVVYDLMPALPLGLVFDADSLKVHGTPGEVSAPRTYTFSGVDRAGSTAELEFSVQVVAASLGFERDIPDQSYIEGQVITPLTLPEATGGAGSVSYTLTPDLPPGLVFTNSTRTLSGTPTDVFQRKTYSYVASDADGVTGERTFSIEVNPSPFAFDGAVADQTYTEGEAIPVLTFPEARAGVLPYTYSLVPALRAGLVFDATAHTLSGTPTEMFLRELYRYSAKDATGARAELTFYIQVDERTFSQRAGRALPAEFLLRGSYPNPFATMASVEFDLPQRARITLEVHNLLGQRVLAWPPKEMEAGWGRRLEMDGLELPSGTYVYRITADMGARASVRSARMVVLR